MFAQVGIGVHVNMFMRHLRKFDVRTMEHENYSCRGMHVMRHVCIQCFFTATYARHDLYHGSNLHMLAPSRARIESEGRIVHMRYD